MEKKRLISVRGMVFTAIMAALICISAPFTIPLPSAVPLSLATFAIYLTGTLLGRAKGTAAVAVYILLGLVGIPVFSGFMGGFAVIAGPTGGYIIGYLPCVFLTGLFADIFGGRVFASAIGMVLGTLVLYIIGTVWFVLFSGADVVTAFMGCVVPFLAGDAVKITAAVLISVPLKKKLAPITEH